MRSPRAPLRLTAEQLQAEDVSYEAWNVVLGHLEGTKKFRNLVRQLPQHWRAVYTTFWLECEVNNGGHHQFFWNSNGALNAETLTDLKLIHAYEYFSIFETALEIYGKHDYQEEKRASGNSWEGFTDAYREKRLEECDNRFYELSEKATVADLLARYILDNRATFLRDETGHSQ